MVVTTNNASWVVSKIGVTSKFFDSEDILVMNFFVIEKSVFRNPNMVYRKA